MGEIVPFRPKTNREVKIKGQTGLPVKMFSSDAILDMVCYQRVLHTIPVEAAAESLGFNIESYRLFEEGQLMSLESLTLDRVERFLEFPRGRLVPLLEGLLRQINVYKSGIDAVLTGSLMGGVDDSKEPYSYQKYLHLFTATPLHGPDTVVLNQTEFDRLAVRIKHVNSELLDTSPRSVRILSDIALAPFRLLRDNSQGS